MITEVMDIISLANKSHDMDLPENFDKMRDVWNQGKSIAARAKQSLFTYPVIFSPGLSEFKTALKITKYLELQYALFTVMSIGLDPMATSSNLGEHLAKFAGESFDTSIKYSLENVNEAEKEIFSREYDNKLEKYTKEYKVVKETFGLEADDEEEENENSVTSANDSKSLLFNEKNLLKASPTIIKLDLFLPNSKKTNITLGIKAYSHFIGSQELISLFNSAIEDKRLLNRFIKLSTGEISFFKDFVFNLDRAKRDKELYRAFGSHPWYQQFMKKKAQNIGSRLLKVISVVNPTLRAVVSGSSNYLPTASIICTIDEISKASQMKYSFLLKNDKVIKGIMEKLMLLSIGIYDPILNSVLFFFNGFKDSVLVSVDEMSKTDSNPEVELIKLMQNLMKRGAI
jgi:translation initiation factor 2 beta subunit (eIF-2beta)/eIF-5